MALLQEYRQLKENFFIMGGHLADDLCQGALPAILAFMYVEGRLTSYADVAFLVMAATLMNAAAQPLTGLWADKRPRPYLMCLGMLTAAAGIMFTGLVESFWILCLLVAVNGLGAAVFHPAAGKLANIFAKQHVGKGMSIFSVGGNIGYALGPLYFTAGYMIFGLKATLLICLPALVMAVIFIGRNRFYARLEEKRATVRRVFLWGLAAGLPLSGLYAWSAMNGHPWGLAAHTLLYTVSVYPTGFAYAAGLALYSLHRKESRVLKLLAAPGRMALTDYIGQSLCGMFIFYGTGLALGADMGLVYVLLTALCVYAAEVAFSHVWMRFCSFGPLEWIWRMLTYGERLPLLRRRS